MPVSHLLTVLFEIFSLLAKSSCVKLASARSFLMNWFKVIKKGIVFSLACVMVLGMMVVNKERVSAHPLFYWEVSENNYIPLDFSWSHISGGAAELSIGYHNVHESIVNNMSYAFAAWPSATNKVNVTQTDTGNSNVDFLTVASIESWNSLTNNGAVGDAAMITVLATTNNRMITDTDSAKIADDANDNLLKYAIVYIHPNYGGTTGDHDYRFVMVHELGHVLGLGHTNVGPDATTEYSVMWYTSETPFFYTPRPHDINDIENKY